MVNIVGMRQDPEFRAMDYSGQLAQMQEAIRLNMAEDPEAQGYAPGDLDRAALEAARTYSPVLKDGREAVLDEPTRQRFAAGLVMSNEKDDELRYAKWLGDQVRSGDQEAQQKAIQWMTGKKLVNETLVGKAVVLSRDLYQGLTDLDDEFDIGMSRESTDKMSEYLASSMDPEVGRKAPGRSRFI